MSTVLILTAGTTADPLLKAIEEHRAEDPTVFVIYGRPFPNQDPNPFEVAFQVRQRALELGVSVETREVPDPEDIDVCLQVARSVLREVAESGRVIVDFTGGTKPLSAAVVHAALTEPLGGQLVLEYTGGSVRDRTGRVLREAMRLRRSENTATEELLRQVLNLLRRFAYREARAFAGKLPERGLARFVRHAVEALYAWDEFDYQASVQSIRKLYETARTMQDVPELAPVARLVSGLLEPGNRIEKLIRDLRELEKGEDRPFPPLDATALLVADALENASRRLHEERPTDCVLRAYRAVECAVQARLLSKQINPWRPRWDGIGPSILTRYLEVLGGREPPRELSLTTGLRLLETLEGSLPAELQERLRDLQQHRNRSYLEHGYQRIDRDTATRLLQYAGELCAHILRMDITELRSQVTHSVWD